MEYNIVKAINTIPNDFLGQERFFVTFAEGPRTGTCENIVGYDTEAKAKRRIRDLKRKEVAELDCNPLTDRDMREMEAAINADLISATVTNTPFALARPVGVYPAVSKNEYRARRNYL